MIVKSPFFYSSFTPSFTPSVLLLEHQLNLFTQFLKEFPHVDTQFHDILSKEKDTRFLFKKVLNLVCYIAVKGGGCPNLSFIDKCIIANVFRLSFERVITELFEEKYFNNKDDIFNINACFKMLS